MPTPSLRSTGLLLLVFACGCGDPPALPDAGLDASSADAGSSRDASTDASTAGECQEVSVASWRLAGADDVSIRYRARIAPAIDGDPWDLYLEFFRYDVAYVGEFPLGSGQDANYGSCAHCVVAFYATNLTPAFLAREGTLVLREDPFNQRLDLTLRDVVLEEVTIGGDALESTPIPGGRCLRLADTTVVGTFPPAGWDCPAEQFDDGETCHCGCGAVDPDCGSQCALPPDPACDPTPLPIEGCAAGDLCTFEGTCAATCQHRARVACASGVCAFSPDGDRCFDPATAAFDDASIGESCEAGNLYCAVDAEGFAMGLCDSDTEELLCRAICEGDEDCTGGDTCYSLFIEPASGRAQGFCRQPPPPCIETGGSCDDHLDCCTVLCEGLAEGSTGTCG